MDCERTRYVNVATTPYRATSWDIVGFAGSGLELELGVGLEGDGGDDEEVCIRGGMATSVAAPGGDGTGCIAFIGGCSDPTWERGEPIVRIVRGSAGDETRSTELGPARPATLQARRAGRLFVRIGLTNVNARPASIGASE